MARPCSVFTAAIGESANVAPETNSDSRQMEKTCRNGVSEKPIMTAPSVASQTRNGSGSPQRSHIAQDEKVAIESIQISARAGNAASRKQPTFVQFSLANISLSIVRASPGSSAFVPTSPPGAGQHLAGPIEIPQFSSLTLDQ